MLKAYSYRIYPTNVQQQILRTQLGAVQFVYNQFLAEQQDRYEKNQLHLSFFDLCRELRLLKPRTPAQYARLLTWQTMTV